MLFQLNFTLMAVSMLISVAFYTILERKFLSYIQIRKGPNKVGLLGILQPFSDAIKLFNKNLLSMELMNFTLSFLAPAMSLLMSISMLLLIPLNNITLFDNKHNILLFFILSSISIYFILLVGWSANSKYSYMGSIRSVAQMISYEVSFFLIILTLVIMSKSYMFTKISESQYMCWYILGNPMIFMIWMISCLAETNRSPFDFAEGESELVSGFNVEYMGGLFALIFLAEYMMMLILSIITTILFFKDTYNITSMFMLILISISLIWVRGTYPRFRYDMLMNLSWKIFLPISISFVIWSFSFSFIFF